VAAASDDDALGRALWQWLATTAPCRLVKLPRIPPHSLLGRTAPPRAQRTRVLAAASSLVRSGRARYHETRAHEEHPYADRAHVEALAERLGSKDTRRKINVLRRGGELTYDVVHGKAIAPHLPDHPTDPRGGRPRVPDRQALAGILFVLREGLRWQSLPAEMGCGSGSTCWRRFAEWTAAGVWDQAHARLLAALGERPFDCVVLDLGLAGTSGFELLERVKADPAWRDLPIIVYTGKSLTPEEDTRLRRYAETIIIKDVKSPERLLDETALFLHRVEANLPDDKRRVLERLHTADAVFQGKRVLVVDDDVRNIFSLTSMLEEHGIEVAFAENGRDALAWLEQHGGDDRGGAPLPTDLVLMDVMMPGMDGYDTTRAVRANPAWRGLPIIAVTAKAMKGDREKCLEAGASDYITKPVDPEQLLSLLRVWLYR